MWKCSTAKCFIFTVLKNEVFGPHPFGVVLTPSGWDPKNLWFLRTCHESPIRQHMPNSVRARRIKDSSAYRKSSICNTPFKMRATFDGTLKTEEKMMETISTPMEIIFFFYRSPLFIRVFSSSEVALLSISKVRVRNLADEGIKGFKSLKKLKGDIGISLPSIHAPHTF